MKLLKNKIPSLLNLIFPPVCMHCEEVTKSSKHPLCVRCLESLEKPERIPLEEMMGLKGISAPFVYFGAVQTLLFQFKEGSTLYLAKGLAGWMALDILKRNWPKPDFLIPIPQTFIRRFTLGCHPSLLLAQELGKILDVPVLPILKRRWGKPLQSQLSLEERREVSPGIFFLSKVPDIERKTIFLVDDMIVTGGTLRAAYLSLKEEFPNAVFAAVFSSSQMGN